MSQNPNSDQDQKNVVTDNIARHAALTIKALLDKRIWLLLKILMVVPGVLYFISPLDEAIPIVDDVGVIWLLSILFKHLIINLIPEVGEEYWPEEFASDEPERPNVINVEPKADPKAETEEPEKTQFTKAGN